MKLNPILLQQQPGQQPGGGGADFFGPLFMFVPLIIIFYLFFIRPESRRRKEKQALLESLKVKDRVVTIGGVYGTIVEIEGDDIVLLVDTKKDVRIRMQRGAVGTVLSGRGEEKT